MIDDKKIEDAAKQHSEESYISDYFQACYKDAFMECAKWVQEEFLKDLWHPVSEEPKKGRVFLYKTIFKGYGLNKIIDGNEWKYIIKYKKETSLIGKSATIDDVKDKGGFYIPTLEGNMKANIGDYIIKGINGEFYPCKPDIFTKTYEKVTE